MNQVREGATATERAARTGYQGCHRHTHLRHHSTYSTLGERLAIPTEKEVDKLQEIEKNGLASRDSESAIPVRHTHFQKPAHDFPMMIPSGTRWFIPRKKGSVVERRWRRTRGVVSRGTQHYGHSQPSYPHSSAHLCRPARDSLDKPPSSWDSDILAGAAMRNDSGIISMRAAPEPAHSGHVDNESNLSHVYHPNFLFRG